MTLSIVIPAYNAAKTLPRCLDSLLNQDLPCAWEAIVVNDGSTDGTAQVVEQYTTVHPQIKLLTQPNGGVSSARNTGMAMATGDLIWFYDADDYVAPGGLGFMLRQFWNEEVDAVTFRSQTLTQEALQSFQEPEQLQGSIVWEGRGQEAIKANRFPWLWMHIFRRSSLGNLKFTVGVPLDEDFAFVTKYYLTNPRLLMTDACIYRYILGATATTNREIGKMRQACEGYITLISEIHEEEQRCSDPTVVEALEKHVIGFLRVPFTTRILASNYDKQSFLDISAKLRSMSVIPAKTGGRYDAIINSLLNFTNWGGYYYIKYKIFGWLYRKVFVPFNHRHKK